MMHNNEQCGIKLKAIKAIMERAKTAAKDVEVVHMCDSVIQLTDELLDEVEND